MEYHSFVLVVLKKLIFSPLIIAAIFFSSQESKAEGGCPKGFFPVGGGYCRNIVCPQSNILEVADSDTGPVMKKYGMKCTLNSTGFEMSFGKWGDQIIPKR